MWARAAALIPSCRSPGLERDSALVTIASIVRGADTDRHDLTPQSAGLLAISMGLRDLSPDDHQVLAHGFVIYDALYAWASRRKRGGA